MAALSTALLVTLGALALCWILAHFKTSRPDGALVQRVHPYRRMMPFIMRRRNESIVYFDTRLRADALLAFLQEARAQEAFRCDMSHILIAAAAHALHQHPRLNRFHAGYRLYQRDGVWITFSMKRQKLDAGARIATVKLRVPPPEEASFATLCQRINALVDVERSDAQTYVDRELGLLLRLPRPLLHVAVPLLQRLDGHNLLPGGFIEGDGMYTSLFLANLGSLDMEAPYHHLYEWGNCPLFMGVGKIADQPWVDEDGQLTVAPVLHVRWSFDERIEDGLSARHALDAACEVLRDPARFLSLSLPAAADAPRA